MKFTNFCKDVQILSLIIGFACVPAAAASDVDDLTAMLHEFLAASDKETAHRRFWAEDLVYTSSNGTRVTKGEILAGFSEGDAPDTPPPVAYSAENVDVRVYGAAAIIAFKLVGTPSDSTDVLYYFNTGTFLKRDDKWQVVAWQATKIPAAEVVED